MMSVNIWFLRIVASLLRIFNVGPTQSIGNIDPGSPASGKFDVKKIDLNRKILIGYHGGCPDGCGAAHMMSEALKSSNPSASIKIVAIGHQQQKFSTVVEPGMVVFSLDISPSLDDAEALRSAHQVFIVDHHVSEAAIQKELEQYPNVCNLSDNSGCHCASSLVHRLVSDTCVFDPDVVCLLHKMDLFEYDLPLHLTADLKSFKAYLTQHGERNVSLELVEATFKDRKKCIAEGRVLADAMTSRTNSLAEGLEVVVETEQFCVMYTFQTTQCRPVDLMYYQEKIDGYIDGKPTLVITQDEQPLSSGLFNLGLRRAGDNLNITEVAAKFKLQSGCASGGGHKFAGGVQFHHSPSPARVREMAVEVMTQLFH